MKKVSRVDEATPCSKVCWTVTVCEPLADWVGTTINFELFSTAEGGTRLQFRHAGLTPQLECFDSCSAGWRQFLRSLINYVDEGQGSPFDAVEQSVRDQMKCDTLRAPLGEHPAK